MSGNQSLRRFASFSSYPKSLRRFRECHCESKARITQEQWGRCEHSIVCVRTSLIVRIQKGSNMSVDRRDTTRQPSPRALSRRGLHLPQPVAGGTLTVARLARVRLASARNTASAKTIPVVRGRLHNGAQWRVPLASDNATPVGTTLIRNAQHRYSRCALRES